MFRIGKFEITNTQYVGFLNEVDPSGDNQLGLYSEMMQSNPRGGGIKLDLNRTEGSKYSSIIGRESNPVAFVDWYDSIRFANWLHNGMGSGDTESGTYVLLDNSPIPTNAASISRQLGAKYFLPNDDEWYKAAYYDPALNNQSGGYFLYAAGSDTLPTFQSPPGTNNSSNYRDRTTGYALTGSSRLEQRNYLTEVGAYENSASPFGTFDQNGNVWEWIEEPFVGSFATPHRVIHGGAWDAGATELLASFRGDVVHNREGDLLGFRIAVAIPEPTSEFIVLLTTLLASSLRPTGHRENMAGTSHEAGTNIRG